MSDLSRTQSAADVYRDWFQYLPASLVLCFGLVATVAAVYAASNYNLAQEHQKFERLANQYTSAIFQSIDRNLVAIRSLAALYAAFKSVEREEFEAFTRTTLSELPGIRAMEWVPRVRAYERSRFEASARADGYPGFRITEADPSGTPVRAMPRPEHFPVYYVEPFKGNEAMLGFDLASNPAWAAALSLARDSGSMVATEPIKLVRGSSEQIGFLILQPIYSDGPPTGQTDDRQRNLQGFALGIFVVGEIVDAALSRFEEAGDLEFYLHDIDAERENRFLHHRPGLERGELRGSVMEAVAARNFSFAEKRNIAGRDWSVVVQRSAAADGGSLMPWAIALLCLMITAAMVWYMISSRNWADSVEEMVVARTADLHARERELSDHRDKLQREVAERERGFSELQREFISMASHEFRTPLAIIDGAAHRMHRNSQDLTPDELKRRVTKIRQSVKRMLNLIDTMLCTSRLDAGKIDMALQSCDLAYVLCDVCERQQEISPDHAIDVYVEGLTERVMADPRLLDQVFTNLLSNAVKYSPHSRRIDVVGRIEGVQAIVSVRDYGVGIPEDEADRLFDRFFRARTSQGIAGTGIGLNLVRRLVEMHDGSIEVESVEGAGAEFTIHLPIRIEQAKPKPVTGDPLTALERTVDELTA